MGRGRSIDRSLWPQEGPYRQLLEFLDHVHVDNGMKSLGEIVSAMTIDSRTRVGSMLRGVNATLPVDTRQAEELIRALGGGDDEVRRGTILYKKASRNLRRNLPFTKPSGQAPVSPTPVPRQLPPSVSAFAGRAAELNALTELLEELSKSGGTVVISAVDGIPGIGKTALAVHWAHRIADQFPDGQLYVNLRGFDPGGLALASEEAIRSFLDAFEVPPERIPASTDAQIALYRSLLAGRRMLLLLDNARDSEHVRSLLPGGGCMVIVTSRNRLAGLIAADGAYPLTLDLLSFADSRELLARRVGRGRVAEEEQEVAEIINLSTRLPLALSIVATRAATHPEFPLASLATELRTAGESGIGVLEVFDTGEVDTSVTAVFSWSYKQLEIDTARIFRLLSLHPGPDITSASAASMANVSIQKARQMLAELARAHLLEERTLNRFTFHDLLRSYAVELANSQDSTGEREAALNRLLDYYLQTAYRAALLLFPLAKPIVIPPPMDGIVSPTMDDYQAAWNWFEAERDVLLGAVKLAASLEGQRGWQLSWTLQDYFRRRGHWIDWSNTQQIALRSAERENDHYGEAYSHHGLGRAFTWLSRYVEAESELMAAIRLFEELDDVAGQADAHLDLAQMFSQNGRPSNALIHGQRGLELSQVTGDQGVQAKALNNTGWYYAQLGQPESALDYCKSALDIFEKIGNRRGQSNTLDSVGYAYHQLNEYRQAIEYYGRSLTLRDELGDRHGRAATLIHLGDTRFATRDLAAAQDAWQEASEILDDLGHPDASEVRERLQHLNPK